MAKANPHVRVGVKPEAAAEGGEGSLFYTINDGDTIECKVLVDQDQIVSVEQCALWNFYNPAPVWVFIGADDPSNDLGVKSGYRAFLPISLKIDGERVIRLWSMSKTSHRQITEIAEMAGSLKGQILKIKRTGSGMKTTHTIVPVGKRVKISETVPTVEQIVDLLGPYTREEIISMIEQKTDEDWDKVVAKVAKKTKGDAKSTLKKKKVEVVSLDDDEDEIEEDTVEEEIEDDDEIEELDLDDDEEDDIV